MAAFATIVGLLAAPRPAAASTCDQFACTTMHDVVPNFAGQPTIRSTRSGAWSSTSTWDLGRLPNASDIVAITGGTVVTVDGTTAVAGVIGVEPIGRLTFRTDISTRLTVGTLQVLPQGALEVGTSAAPIAATVTAEIVIANRPLDLTNDGIGVFDPRQFGTSLLSIDGRITMFGAARTAFVRLATEPAPGDVALRLTAPVSGWRPGDRLVVPDSKHVANSLNSSYVFEGENPVVSSVSSDGLTVYLASALLYAHPGARDGNDVLEFLPHVGNLTRNIVVRSEAPTGTRGHTFLTERSEVDIQHASFRNLGRATVDAIDSTTFDAQGNVLHMGTNHIGRYPLHLHHVLGSVTPPASGHQFTINGNVIDDDAVVNRRKWAMTIHASHYGLISNNVVHNAGGWGIGTEDGSESFNEFTSNFIVKVRGEGIREIPEGGNGMWFRGPNNYVRDNVIANVRGNVLEGSHGIQYFMMYLGNICVPNFPGADPHTQCTNKNGNAIALPEFAGNEVYGATEIGFAIWWLGNDGYTPFPITESIVKDFHVWHFTLYGYYGYQSSKLTFDGFVARGRKAVLANSQEFLRGIWFSDYMVHDFTLRNSDIQNMRTGIMAPYFSKGTTIIEDSYLRNANNITVVTIGSPGTLPSSALMPAKQTIVRNVSFAAVNGSVGAAPQYDIYMNYWDQFGTANLIKRDAVFVYDYNQVAGDDFQVFYNEQAPGFIVPQSYGNLTGSPVAGLTNAQNWSTYGIAIAGEVANNTTTRSGVYGLVRLGAPQLLPDAPTITGITPGTTQLSVAFTAGVSGVAAITNYEYSLNGGTTWATRSPVSTSSPLVIGSLAPATSYAVKLRAINANGHSVASNLAQATTMAATPVRLTTYSTSRTATTVPNPVTFTAAATGGTGAYEYRFDLYDAVRGAWTLLRGYSTTAAVTWTPSTAGTYWVQVWVRGVGASSAWDDWRNSDVVTVSAAATTPVRLATLTTSRTTATVPNPVTFTASATGGTSAYEYRFALYDAGRATWTILQNYATTATVTWTPAAAGTYWVQVWVRAVGASSAWDDWRNSSVVTVSAATTAPVRLATLSTSTTSTTVPNPVTFTASATGGTSAYEYSFALYDSGRSTWTALQNYATNASVTWTPIAAGTYWVQVWVRAVGSSAAWEDWRNSDVVTVTGVAVAPVKLVGVTTSSTFFIGAKPVVFGASATGGSGAYEYRFALYDSGRGTWTMLQNYATNASVTWTPRAAGTYWVQVWVRGVGSASAWEDWRNGDVVTVMP